MTAKPAWFDSEGLFRRWLGRSGPPLGGADAETMTADEARFSEGTARAVYVTGPSGGSRHLLPESVVCVLGRGGESRIVVDDPRVSRSHAALHVFEQIMLSDLSSANGTFIGKERLRPGEARPLALGQSFFIGDTALVVRATSLRRCAAKRVSDIEQVRERLGKRSGVLVIRVRSLAPNQAQTLELILGELLQLPDDWLMRVGSDQVLIGIAEAGEADAPRLEQAVLRQLISWGTVADVESRFVSRADLEPGAGGLAVLLRGEVSIVLNRGKVIFRDPAMEELKRRVARVATAGVTVLIQGETGVGKDVVASMLHELSSRSGRAFVGLNCASFPEQLLESELFGHERGAFTGALASKPGLFEVAEGGSIFLDEIGDLPLALQAKLLRVIESREITRVGGLKPRPIDVRFIAATNKDLEQEIACGRFRQDLYYRLNGVALAVPPLRQRRSEIEPLARLFLDGACLRFGAGVLQFSEAAIAALVEYDWPGNVRELRNAVERAVLLVSEQVIEPSHLGLPSLQTEPPQVREPAGHPLDGELTSERDRIARALEHCGGNQTRAAKLLGMPRRTLVRRIAQLGLRRPRE